MSHKSSFFNLNSHSARDPILQDPISMSFSFWSFFALGISLIEADIVFQLGLSPVEFPGAA